MMHALRTSLAAALAAGLLVLAACGGGGGDDTPDNTPAPGAQEGTLSLSFAGGAVPGVGRVWGTVESVALHEDPNRAWSAGDDTWKVIELSSPVTVDLASLTNGLVGNLVLGNALPAGIYGQVRLFLTPYDEALTGGAKAYGLVHNQQVDYVDAAGNAQHVPLELADMPLGLRVPGPVQIHAQQSNQITLALDLAHNLVRVDGADGVDHFLLRPDLRPMRLEATGAIVGLIDKTHFCAAGVRAPDCIHDVVVSALSASPDGRYKRVVRSATVTLETGGAVFALYPLPESPKVDVVITGRNMQTMVVRDVPSPPADLLHAVPTQLGVNPGPMVPMFRPDGDGEVALAATVDDPSTQLLFAQTLPDAGALPLEVVSANVDPFTGLLARPLAVPGGALQVATYSETGPLTFAEVTPVEGAGRFSVATRGTPTQDMSAFVQRAVPPGEQTLLTVPAPVPHPGVGSGTLAVTVGAASADDFDAATLVVADVGGVVATRDVSALLAGGGTVEVTLPAGATAAGLGGTAVYAVSLRGWKRGDPSSTLAWGRAANPVDLRSATSASTSVALP